jgi:hypothetical protein
VGSNPTLSAIFLAPAKLQYYRRLATFSEHLKDLAWLAFTRDSAEVMVGSIKRSVAVGRRKMQNSTCASRTHKENAAGASRSTRLKRPRKTLLVWRSPRKLLDKV